MQSTRSEFPDKSDRWIARLILKRVWGYSHNLSKADYVWLSQFSKGDEPSLDTCCRIAGVSFNLKNGLLVLQDYFASINLDG